jgi:ABC-type multidrug transport system fused ATPase/permease subunit
VAHEVFVAAALAANADGVIDSLPQGYDTVIGAGGVRLDSQQRQALALARTMLAEVVERRSPLRSPGVGLP